MTYRTAVRVADGEQMQAAPEDEEVRGIGDAEEDDDFDDDDDLDEEEDEDGQ